MGCETECGSLPLDLGVNRRGGDCGFAGFAGFSGALVGGVTGSLANTATTVASGATLAGNGTLGGPTTINGTLSPGDGNIATLRINNSLTLAAGSTTAMEIGKTGGTLRCDLVQGVSTLTCGGTLTVTASGDPLSAGDIFTLFSAASYGGTFSSIMLPPG